MVLLDPDVGVHALAADQLKVGESAVLLLVLCAVKDLEVVPGVPVSHSQGKDVAERAALRQNEFMLSSQAFHPTGYVVVRLKCCCI